MKLSKTIFITGANGFIGSHIKNFLITNSNYKNFRFLTPSRNELDLTDKNSVSKFVKLNNPRILIHCAAFIPEFNKFEKIKYYNNLIDSNIVDAFSDKKNSRCIYLSGTSVYAKSNGHLTEESLLRTENEYIQSKIDGESLFLDNCSKQVILRISAPYGSKQRAKTVIQKFVESALENKPLYIYGKGDRVQNFTYIKDILSALDKVLLSDIENGIFNICSDDIINMHDLADLIIKITSSNSEVISLQDLDPDDNKILKLSNEKAKLILGWRPQFDIKAGLIDMLNDL